MLILTGSTTYGGPTAEIMLYTSHQSIITTDDKKRFVCD